MNTIRKVWAAAFVAVAAGLVLAEAALAAETWRIPYQGRSIRVHVFAPDTPKPWPTVMVLHGASGIGRGHMIWPAAEALAKKGVAAAVVRYYDGLPRGVKRKQSVRIFDKRERILDHVIRALLNRPEVRGPKLGVFGYSLGGFHAIGMAAKDDRIAAVVSLAGGLSGHYRGPWLKNAAPMLLVHGTADRIVPYRRSRIARAAWQQSGRPVELMTLRGVGHVPYGGTRANVFNRSADYLMAHLARTLPPPLPRPRPERRGEVVQVAGLSETAVGLQISASSDRKPAAAGEAAGKPAVTARNRQIQITGARLVAPNRWTDPNAPIPRARAAATDNDQVTGPQTAELRTAVPDAPIPRARAVPAEPRSQAPANAMAFVEPMPRPRP